MKWLTVVRGHFSESSITASIVTSEVTKLLHVWVILPEVKVEPHSPAGVVLEHEVEISLDPLEITPSPRPWVHFIHIKAECGHFLADSTSMCFSITTRLAVGDGAASFWMLLVSMCRNFSLAVAILELNQNVILPG